MSTEPKDLPIETVVKTQLPPPLTNAEKEALEGRIAELEAENEELKKELASALKVAPSNYTPNFEKVKSFNLDDWLPKLF